MTASALLMLWTVPVIRTHLVLGSGKRVLQKRAVIFDGHQKEKAQWDLNPGPKEQLYRLNDQRCLTRFE